MKKELFKRNIRILSFLLIISCFIGLLFLFTGYFQKSAEKERTNLETEKRKEVMAKANSQKDKSAYQDETTGQYIAGEEADQYEDVDNDDDIEEDVPTTDSLNVKYRLDIPDTEIDAYNQKHSTGSSLKYKYIYVLEGGDQFPVVDEKEAEKVQKRLKKRCLYKDKKGTKYKDALVDASGNLLQQVWGSGDINYKIFNQDTGEIKEDYIDSNTGKIREDALEYSRTQY